METQEREAATGRSRNVVQILPHSMESVSRFLTGPLEHVDAAAGGTQLVVITEDQESAVALAEAVLRLTGIGGIELFPVTSPRRAARLIQGRPILAIAGTPGDLAELIRGSQLKLEAVRTIVLAWVDDLLEGDPDATSALELLMTEIPKDAARIVVTATADARVDRFVERYLRRARRVDERDVPEAAEPISLQYVTASQSGRLASLRRLLDDLDPPSATIVVGSGESEQSVSNLLRALGYPAEGDVRVSRTDVAPGTHAVIFFGLPATRQLLEAAVTATPVRMIAMVQPRELAQLRRTAGGEVRPLTLSDSGRSARDRERVLRRELSTVLESGLPAREILALEPLLDRHDGIEIAAAALRLLERERAQRGNAEAATAVLAPRPQDPRSAGFERRPVSRDRERGGPPRGDRGGRGGPPRGDRGGRGGPPRGDRSGPPRGDRSGPPRGDRSEPPRGDRSGPSRGARPDSRGGRPATNRGPRPPRDRS